MDYEHLFDPFGVSVSPGQHSRVWQPDSGLAQHGIEHRHDPHQQMYGAPPPGPAWLGAFEANARSYAARSLFSEETSFEPHGAMHIHAHSQSYQHDIAPWMGLAHMPDNSFAPPALEPDAVPELPDGADFWRGPPNPHPQQAQSVPPVQHQQVSTPGEADVEPKMSRLQLLRQQRNGVWRPTVSMDRGPTAIAEGPRELLSLNSTKSDLSDRSMDTYPLPGGGDNFQPRKARVQQSSKQSIYRPSFLANIPGSPSASASELSQPQASKQQQNPPGKTVWRPTMMLHQGRAPPRNHAQSESSGMGTPRDRSAMECETSQLSEEASPAAFNPTTPTDSVATSGGPKRRGRPPKNKIASHRMTDGEHGGDFAAAAEARPPEPRKKIKGAQPCAQLESKGSSKKPQSGQMGLLGARLPPATLLFAIPRRRRSISKQRPMRNPSLHGIRKNKSLGSKKLQRIPSQDGLRRPLDLSKRLEAPRDGSGFSSARAAEKIKDVVGQGSKIAKKMTKIKITVKGRSPGPRSQPPFGQEKEIIRPRPDIKKTKQHAPLRPSRSGETAGISSDDGAPLILQSTRSPSAQKPKTPVKYAGGRGLVGEPRLSSQKSASPMRRKPGHPLGLEAKKRKLVSLGSLPKSTAVVENSKDYEKHGHTMAQRRLSPHTSEQRSADKSSARPDAVVLQPPGKTKGERAQALPGFSPSTYAPEIQKKFHPGEVVWAKMPKYPWWPAQVQQPDDPSLIRIKHKREDTFVVFYGDSNYMWLPPNCIRAFHDHYEHRESAKSRSLQAAIESAWQAIGKQRPKIRPGEKVDPNLFLV